MQTVVRRSVENMSHQHYEPEPGPGGRRTESGQVGSDRSTRHMRRALALAAMGRGRVSPNPLVGCVLVAQDGAVVGEGWHAQVGGPHAEVEALASAGEAARGATAFVTLEPCDHHGRTGPCTDALIEAGVARVVVAVMDPDPRVAGRGIAKLRSAGIAVEVGLLADEAEAINEPYLTSRRASTPSCSTTRRSRPGSRGRGRRSRSSSTASRGPRLGRGCSSRVPTAPRRACSST